MPPFDSVRSNPSSPPLALVLIILPVSRTQSTKRPESLDYREYKLLNDLRTVFRCVSIIKSCIRQNSGVIVENMLDDSEGDCSMVDHLGLLLHSRIPDLAYKS